MPAYYLHNIFVGCHVILLILLRNSSKEILNKQTALYISLYMFVVLLVKTSSALALH